ncbi:MAG: hypothetical protein V2A54_17865 [Bacteroidota bacterium]
MKTTIRFTILAVAIAGMMLVSCKKKEKESLKTTASDNAVAEASFNDVYKQVDMSAREQASGLKLLDWSCATITVSPADTFTFPKTITVDFGTNGCTGSDGILRKGKIIYTMTGKYRTPGSIITVTLDNYYRDGNLIEGTKTITNKGKNGSNHTYFEIVVSNAKISTDDGRVISWNSTRTREWMAGEDTPWPTYTDDVYHITGSANGINSEENAFTITITNPLEIALDCRWIRSGTLELTPDGADTRTLDFGTGDCDNKATLTIKNKTYEILLH